MEKAQPFNATEVAAAFRLFTPLVCAAMISLLFSFAACVAAATHVDPEAPSSWKSGEGAAQFSLFKLDPNNSFGALSLDGSPGAFYWHEGTSDNWAFYFEGGGWLGTLNSSLLFLS